MSDYPQRPESHRLEGESEGFFRRCLPRHYVCDVPGNDYGIDFRVGLVTDGQLQGKSFIVQLKAAAAESDGGTVPVTLSIATYNYLRDMLEVAILVKYVASESEAYWMFWKDIPAPPEGQKTFTVRVPRTQRLSQNPWPEIEAHIGFVHERKLGATRGG